MKRWIWPVVVTAAIASDGCDQVGQLLGVVGASYRPPFQTGAVRGRVVDRNGNPLVGAQVSNGAAVFFTASDPSVGAVKVKDDLFNPSDSTANQAAHQVTLGAGEFMLTKIAANTITSITAQYDGQITSPVQVFVKAQTFSAGSSNSFTPLTADIKLPVDGPVDSNHPSAVTFLGTSIAGNVVTVSAASNSVNASYAPSDTVSVFLQAPPGSKGATVYNALVTYFPAGTTDFTQAPIDTTTTTGVGPNGNPLNRPLQFPVTIVSGSALHSGPQNQVDVKLSSTNPAFINYLRTNNQLVAKIDLIATDSFSVPALGAQLPTSAVLTDRNSRPLSAVVTMRFQSL
jgi:hypothetical protein